MKIESFFIVCFTVSPTAGSGGRAGDCQLPVGVLRNVGPLQLFGRDREEVVLLEEYAVAPSRSVPCGRFCRPPISCRWGLPRGACRRCGAASFLGKGPETVFCPNYYQEVGQILAQAESIGLTVPFLGGDGWDGLEGYATAEQLKDSYFCANYAKGASADFESAYKAEYGEDYPNGFAPLGYDAATTVLYGIQAAEDAGLEAGPQLVMVPSK